MDTEKTMETVAIPAPEAEEAARLPTRISGALAAGSKAYASGVAELGRALIGFGREVLTEAGQHVRATAQAKNLRHVAELQAAWAQHRVETSAAHTKEFTDLVRARAEDVIAPFAALLRQDKAA